MELWMGVQGMCGAWSRVMTKLGHGAPSLEYLFLFYLCQEKWKFPSSGNNQIRLPVTNLMKVQQ
jgi:hypothetical protein